MVKRHDSPVGWMKEADDGDFVSYASYERLRQVAKEFVEAFEDEVGVMNVHYHYGRIKDVLQTGNSDGD